MDESVVCYYSYLGVLTDGVLTRLGSAPVKNYPSLGRNVQFKDN